MDLIRLLFRNSPEVTKKHGCTRKQSIEEGGPRDVIQQATLPFFQCYWSISTNREDHLANRSTEMVSPFYLQTSHGNQNGESSHFLIGPCPQSLPNKSQRQLRLKLPRQSGGLKASSLKETLFSPTATTTLLGTDPNPGAPTGPQNAMTPPRNQKGGWGHPLGQKKRKKGTN